MAWMEESPFGIHNIPCRRISPELSVLITRLQHGPVKNSPCVAALGQLYTCTIQEEAVIGHGNYARPSHFHISPRLRSNLVPSSSRLAEQQDAREHAGMHKLPHHGRPFGSCRCLSEVSSLEGLLRRGVVIELRTHRPVLACPLRPVVVHSPALWSVRRQ